MVTAFLLVGCAEEEKPVEVPGDVQAAVRDLLTAVDPTAKLAFTGETCDTDPLADPADDHRWRMTATLDGGPDDLRAAGVKLGWQPELAEDGTLILSNNHRFGEPVKVVVGDGTARMLVEKDCGGSEMTAADHVADGAADPTGRQRDRLADLVDTVNAAVADIRRALTVRQKAGVSTPEPGPGGYGSCDAGERSGAAWHSSELVYAEPTSDTDVVALSTRLTDAVGGEWRVRDRREDLDADGGRRVSLVLELPKGAARLAVSIDHWAESVGRGVRLHVSGAHTMCVPVDAE